MTVVLFVISYLQMMVCG